jgi:hypothetical protein
MNMQLGGEGRVPADLDGQIAPIGVEDVKRIVVHVGHRLLSFDVVLRTDIPHGRLRPSRGADGVGVSGPDEGLGVVVVIDEVAIDRGLQVDEGLEHAPLQAAAPELGEEAFDGTEPGGRDWGKLEGPVRMAGEPGPDFGMFVAAVVVKDNIDQPAGRKCHVPVG